MTKPKNKNFWPYLRPIFTANTFFCVANAILSPFLVLYFREFVATDQGTTFIASAGLILSLIATLVSAYIIRRIGKERSLFIGLFIATLALAALAIIDHVSTLVLFYGIFTFASIWASFAVELFLLHFTPKKQMGKTTGIIGSLCNAGWVAGPIIGGLLAGLIGFRPAIIIVSLVVLTALIIFSLRRKEKHVFHYTRPIRLFASFKNYFKNSALVKIYLVSAGLAYNYAGFFFFPLFLASQGRSITEIGIFQTIGFIPFLFEFPIGNLVDKYGEKVFFIFGFLIMGITTFGVVGTNLFALQLLLYFINNIGSSFIERTQYSHFYRIVSEKDLGRTTVFYTASRFAWVLTPLLIAGVLTFTDLTGWFFILGASTFAFAIVSYFLKNNHYKQAEADNLPDSDPNFEPRCINCKK